MILNLLRWFIIDDLIKKILLYLLILWKWKLMKFFHQKSNNLHIIKKTTFRSRVNVRISNLSNWRNCDRISVKVDAIKSFSQNYSTNVQFFLTSTWKRTIGGLTTVAVTIALIPKLSILPLKRPQVNAKYLIKEIKIN